MPTVMSMSWSGVTPEQYDETLRVVRWVEEKPDGAMFHVAWFADGGLHVTDVWQSEAQWDAFLNDRLMPGIQQVGIAGQPDVQLTEAHAVFAPGYE
jgi:hypothetical protein